MRPACAPMCHQNPAPSHAARRSGWGSAVHFVAIYILLRLRSSMKQQPSLHRIGTRAKRWSRLNFPKIIFEQRYVFYQFTHNIFRSLRTLVLER
jgi:hypothetical protein